MAFKISEPIFFNYFALNYFAIGLYKERLDGQHGEENLYSIMIPESHSVS